MDEVNTVKLNEAVWKEVLRFYLAQFKGPDAEKALREALHNYVVLRRSGTVPPGTYVRYMRKGLLNNHLHRGGWVQKCTSKSIQLVAGQHRSREWSIRRNDHFVFVCKDYIPGPHQTNLLLLAKHTLRQDTARRDAEQPKVRYRAKFIE